MISETAARKYFGAEDPIGKHLIVENEFDLTVTGIMRDMPSNSHFRCDFLASFATLETDHRWYGDITDFPTQGFNLNVYTYLLMPKDYPGDAFPKKITTFLETYLGDQATKGMLSQRFTLQPITAIYLYSNLDAEIGTTSDITYVYIFTILALFVILLACINYMNLSTARAATRAKEVGLRKVIGAQRRQLIYQFMSETLCVAFLALFIALGLVEFALPFFSELAGQQITVNYADTRLWLMVLGITLFVGVLAGGYPALFLSAFQPITILKGTILSNSATMVVRKALVVLQFTISIIMIIGTGIAFRQLNYLQNKTLGFDREHLVVVPLMNDSIRQRYPTWKQALVAHPEIVHVTGASSMPGEQTFGRYLMQPAGAGDKPAGVTALYTTDFDYVPTLGIELVAGQDFSRNEMMDVHQTALINESAAMALGLEKPIGMQLELPHIPLTRTVIGVVRDFHTQSLHHPVEPIMLMVSPEDEAQFFVYTMIRIRGGSISQTITFIQQTWDEIYADYPFEYSFLDQDLNHQYRTEQRLQQIFGIAAFVSIVISCIGIFGLASFMVERRTKELGVRKVLGASKTEILRLLSMEYVKLVLLANLIAWPIAYMVMKQWLGNFVYRIKLDPDIFLLTGMLTLGITLLTIGYHTVKATLANPVDVLRYE